MKNKDDALVSSLKKKLKKAKQSKARFDGLEPHEDHSDYYPTGITLKGKIIC